MTVSGTDSTGRASLANSPLEIASAVTLPVSLIGTVGAFMIGGNASTSALECEQHLNKNVTEITSECNRLNRCADMSLIATLSLLLLSVLSACVLLGRCRARKQTGERYPLLNSSLESTLAVRDTISSSAALRIVSIVAYPLSLIGLGASSFFIYVARNNASACFCNPFKKVILLIGPCANKTLFEREGYCKSQNTAYKAALVASIVLIVLSAGNLVLMIKTLQRKEYCSFEETKTVDRQIGKKVRQIDGPSSIEIETLQATL